jgi:hypothetical protein
MATWDDLARYVRSTYTVAEERPGFMMMVFDIGGGRSQIVSLSQQSLLDGAEDWAVIESPFAEVGSVSLQRVLEEVGGAVCGGAALQGKHVVFRHSVPLANLDLNEFERPLTLVMGTADRLERQLFGGDKY